MAHSAKKARRARHAVPLRNHCSGDVKCDLLDAIGGRWRDTSSVRRANARQIELFADVNSDVEHVVIPVSLVIAAPSALLIELRNVAVNLAAVLAVLGGVAVNLGLGILQTLVTRLALVVVGTRRTAEWQRQSDSQCTHQDNSNWFSHMCTSTRTVVRL